MVLHAPDRGRSGMPPRVNTNPNVHTSPAPVLCNPPSDADLQRMKDASRACEDSYFKLFMALDAATTHYNVILLDTVTLSALAAAREATAALFEFLPPAPAPVAIAFEPGCVGYAKHTSPLVAQLIQDYRDGLLTPEEAAQLISEVEAEEQATREHADNGDAPEVCY